MAKLKLHIWMFSGGKDSTAQLLRNVKENKYPIDEIIFCDAGKEFPAMYKHVDKFEKAIGIKITRLKPEGSFEYYMHEHILTKGKRKGEKGYSWPDFRNRWCTYLLKKRVSQQYLKGKNTIEYHGIAYNELARTKKNKEKRITYPLVEWKMTNDDCLNYCYAEGFNWDGLYKKFKRVSCYCCPLKTMGELRIIYNEYPDLWQKIKNMDRGTWRTFKPRYSIKQVAQSIQKWAKKETNIPQLFENG